MKPIFSILLLAAVIISPFAASGQVNITVVNKALTQNFDSLARTNTSTVMPVGWHYSQSNGTKTYRANVGDSAGANIYSYGPRNGLQVLNRALGSISSAKSISIYGAEFVNNTGYPIDQLLIAYTVEQWHLGATGRTDTTEFDFSTNATKVDDKNAKWKNVNYLDLISPVTKGTVGALNGINALNQSKLSYKMTGLSIAAGDHFWIRWYDKPIAGNNDGLAIENFSLTPFSTVYGPTVVTKIATAKIALPTTPGIPDTTLYGKFSGIVLSPNFQADASGVIQFSLRDASGAITCISSKTNFGYKVNIGDSLYITGKIRSYKYLAYIELDTLKVLNAVKAGNPSTLTAIAVTEPNESNLIKLSSLTLTATATWDTTGASVAGGFFTTARGVGGNISIFINKNSDLFLKPKPTFPFNITGIALQTSTSPNGGYFLWTRFIKDIDTLPTPKVYLHNIGQVNTFRPNPGPAYGRADSTNKKVMVKGIVHSPNLLYGGTYFNLIDRTGAITVLNTAVINGYNPKIGDSVLVRGTILQANGLIVIYPDSIHMMAKATTLTPPKTITGAITKPLESYLLTLKKMKIVDPSLWDSTNAKTYNMFEVRIYNGKDTFFMDISKTTDLFKRTVLQGAFNVTGVVGEYSTNMQLPFNDHYLIIPRGSFDIQPSITPVYKIAQIHGFNPKNGAADSNGVNCILKGVVESGIISDTGTIVYAIADNTGSIVVANLNKTISYTPAIGDSIGVEGTVGQTTGLTYFGADSVMQLNAKNTIVHPVVLNKLDEPDESALITIQGYTMWNPNQWDNIAPANKNGFNVQFVRGTDTVIVHISKNVPELYNLPYAQKPTGKVDITGIELQKTTANRPFTNYYMVPRILADITANTGIESFNNQAANISVYPNPARSTVSITSTSSIETIVVSDIMGNALKTIKNLNTSSIKLEITDLKPGIYTLQINNKEGYSIQKLVKE